MEEIDISRRQGESEIAFIYRVCHSRGLTLELQTWDDVADYLNDALDYDYTESYYRKQVQNFDKIFAEIKGELIGDDYARMIDKKTDTLYKQQVKTRDKLREMRSHLRDEARIEILAKEVKRAAASLEPLNMEFYTSVIEDGVNEGVLLLSDWHIGAEFSNFKNSYNLEIAMDRLAYLVDSVIRYAQILKIRHLHVVNLGDMIEGLIHVSTRVESELGAVEQTIKAGEHLAWVLLRLEKAGLKITYHMVLDNHSRTFANKKEHIEKENFGKLIHWWLEERLQNAKSEIEFVQNEIDDNIGTFTLENGKECAFVHGHLDKINTVFQNLGGLLRKPLDYVFMGHYHIAKMKEFQGGKVFVNGSLKGLDPYALNNRYMGQASQFLLVLDGNNEIPIVINV